MQKRQQCTLRGNQDVLLHQCKSRITGYLHTDSYAVVGNVSEHNHCPPQCTALRFQPWPRHPLLCPCVEAPPCWQIPEETPQTTLKGHSSLGCPTSLPDSSAEARGADPARRLPAAPPRRRRTSERDPKRGFQGSASPPDSCPTWTQRMLSTEAQEIGAALRCECCAPQHRIRFLGFWVATATWCFKRPA